MGHVLASESTLSRTRVKRRTIRFEDTENFVPRDKAHLGNTVRVTECNTDLGRCETFTCELYDMLNDVLWRRS
jgi:hypothetical protein